METVDYGQVEAYLNSFVNYELLPGFGFAESGYDLAHVEELLRRLCSPHLGPRTVHVAGSKGKGSASVMIASALSACGFITGLYTSPHLIHLGERIRVNGTCAQPGELLSLLDRVRPHLEAMRSEGSWRAFSYFELLTVVAFMYFRTKGVQFQVIEVGLGGRLDATNVVAPDVCVIMPISLEHTAVLGSTIAHIAAEKAGIIKHGATVVAAPQLPEAMDVIKSACRGNGAPLLSVADDFSWETLCRSSDRQAMVLEGPGGRHVISVPLIATYEAENVITALGALDALRVIGVELYPGCIARGLSSVRWPGRFQLLAREPRLVLDGAHNPASMRRLAENVALLHPDGDIVFVLGFSSDKDVAGAVAELSSTGGQVLLTRSQQPRALAPSDLAGRVSGLGLRVRCISTPERAMWSAREMVGRSGMVVVAGSLYLVGEILAEWQRDKQLPLRWAKYSNALTRSAGP